MMADLLRLVVVLAVLVISQLVQKSNSVSNSLEVPANVGCACPEETLTFTCNIVGAGNTLWGGTAFNCPDSSNEIILRHSQFADGHSGRCTNDALMARSIRVIDNNCFTSQLEVMFSASLNNTTVRCTHDSLNSGHIVIGSVSILLVASGFDPPDSLNLVNVSGGQAILEWSPAVSTCPQDIIYNISSNCSSCSSRLTSSTTTSCPVPQPNVTTGDTVCTFSIQSVVCESIGGEQSHPLEVIIPAQPPSVEIIPIYSSADNSLNKLRILGNNLLIATSGGTDLFITRYNVIYSDPTTGSVVDSAIVNVEAASENITPPASLCPFTISVVADNGFEQRNLADPITIGCTNRFVEVQYNSATSTITCTFLNPSDSSLKTCHVSPCDEKQTNNIIAQESSSSSTITLSLQLQNSLCYTVTARNSSFAVAVEGHIAGGAAVSTEVIIGVVVVVSVLILLVVLSTFVVLLVCFCRRKKKTGGVVIFARLSIEVELNLQEIDQGRFKIYTIENSCKLREAALFKKPGQFKRGYTYYEFKHEKENISEDKEIILMHKDTKHFFTPGTEVAQDTLRQYKLLGDGVKKPDLGNYIVFVQSTGSGARHLPAGSRLLYDKLRSKWQPNDTLLMKLASNHFMKSTIESELSLEEFRDKYSLTKNKCNVFLELKDVDRENIKTTRDVILMKENGDLFTGPGARSMTDAPNMEYRIFVLCTFKNDPQLKPGTDVLHQVPRANIKDRFHVLKVKQDNIQMSTFVQEELKVKYENGRAFYEFTGSEEDLQFYKEVVRMPKSIYSKYSAKQQEDEGDSESKLGKYLDRLDASELETGIRYYYSFSDAPGRAIKPPASDMCKVFVQSTSQGSRCLKSETLLLYKATD